MMPLILFALGLGAGGLGVLLGVGGGVILVPALVFLTDLPFASAVGTSLLCIVATSVAGSAVQFARGTVDAELAVRLQAFSVTGAVVGGLAAPIVPVRWLYIAFGILLVVTAERTWPRRSDAHHGSVGRRPRLAAAAAGGGGVVASLLGTGAGIVFTPLLHLIVGLDFHRAAATSVYLIGVTAASAGLVYLMRGDVAMSFVGPTMLGVLVGATVAARTVPRISPAWLKRAFAVLLLYVAVRMLARGLSGA